MITSISKRTWPLAVACVALCAVSILRAHADEYEVVLLGDYMPADINDRGMIVGTVEVEPGDSRSQRAFLFDGRELHVLGVLPDRETSTATALNDRGQVVGYSRSQAGRDTAFVWDADGGMRALRMGIAFDINDEGEIVGDGWMYSSRDGFRVLDDPTDTLQHWTSQAINGGGQVVGQHSLDRERIVAFVCSRQLERTDLGTLGGGFARAVDVNNRSQVVGFSHLERPKGQREAKTRAFIWTADEGMRDLGTLGGDYSRAVAINDHGQVVGMTETATRGYSRCGFIWDAEGGMRNLDEMLPDDGVIRSIQVYGLNDHGQIVGTAGIELEPGRSSPTGVVLSPKGGGPPAESLANIDADLRRRHRRALSSGATAIGAFHALGARSSGSNRVWFSEVRFSADRSVVLGFTLHDTPAYLWRDEQWISLGRDYFATAISADGAVIVGGNERDEEAAVWRDGQWTRLSFLPGVPSPESAATDVSADGHVIVGQCFWRNRHGVFRWEDGVMKALPGTVEFGPAVSANGKVIVGSTRIGASSPRSFRWTAESGLAILESAAFGFSQAAAVSDDGSVIVGTAASIKGTQAFRWTAETGIVGLGYVVPGEEGANRSEALAVSGNGSVVVGTCTQNKPRTAAIAFIWDAEHGMRFLKPVIEEQLGIDLSGWTLFRPTDVSVDGRTIAGIGRNPEGLVEGWVVTLPRRQRPLKNLRKPRETRR